MLFNSVDFSLLSDSLTTIIIVQLKLIIATILCLIILIAFGVVVTSIQRVLAIIADSWKRAVLIGMVLMIPETADAGWCWRPCQITRYGCDVQWQSCDELPICERLLCEAIIEEAEGERGIGNLANQSTTGASGGFSSGWIDSIPSSGNWWDGGGGGWGGGGWIPPPVIPPPVIPPPVIPPPVIPPPVIPPPVIPPPSSGNPIPAPPSISVMIIGVSSLFFFRWMIKK